MTEEFTSDGKTSRSAVAKLPNCKFPLGSRYCRWVISSGVFNDVTIIT